MIPKTWFNVNLIWFAVCFILCCAPTSSTTKQPIIDSIKIEPLPDVEQPDASASTVVTKPSARMDLPINWLEISDTNGEWSYGLPITFDNIVNRDFNLLTAHHSTTEQISVSFESSITTRSDIEWYVINDFVTLKTNEGAEILAERIKTTPKYTTVAVQILYPKKDNTHKMSLDFFRISGTKVYHMSCFGEAMILKTNAALCFKIADTLENK